MRIKFLATLLVLVAVTAAAGQIFKFGGVRASRVLQSYPNRQFPASSYWVQSSKWMAGKFAGAAPAAIWIVSLAGDAGESLMSFPADGKSYPNVTFASIDYNEVHLNAFDTSGVRVWLQVESGSANVDTLIELVLARYKKHHCVVGFGIDVEWLDWKTNSGGRKLTDSLEVKRWEEHVRKFDTTYTMFVKHYGKSWMPAKYRGKLLFVDDSQEFTAFSSGSVPMLSEFKAWGSTFAPSDVAFQFGYPIDSTWWRTYSDPAGYIGSTLFSQIPNAVGMIWVDFTLTKVFPITTTQQWRADDLPLIFAVSPAFPNPFNPVTTIRFSVHDESIVRMTIYDAAGRNVAALVNESLSPGVYQVRWNAENVSSGTYYCVISGGAQTRVQKLLLVK